MLSPSLSLSLSLSLSVGGGPVGLRLAIDCILLGCDVRVIEKRPSFSRNNVLHLWPFTIEDLRQLGAKKFCGKFCAGAIDHICTLTLNQPPTHKCVQSLHKSIRIYIGVVIPGTIYTSISAYLSRSPWRPKGFK